MEHPFLSSTPAKRPFEAHDSIPPSINALHAHSANGAFKRRPMPPPPSVVVSPGHVAFRLLCPASKTGGIIGKSGNAVNLIRQETGAKIRVQDAVPDCDERVILVAGPTTWRAVARPRYAGGEEADVGDGGVSPVQEALIRVFDRVLEAEMEGPAAGGAVSCRLLVPTGQVGPVMGKGGRVIEKIRRETGARIRVLPSEQLPPCASPSDEVMQMTGDAGAVRRALLIVSRCIQESPPSDKAQLVVSRPVVATSPGTYPDAQEEHLFNRGTYGARGQSFSTTVERIPIRDLKKAQQEVSFRLLCSNDRVGGVIGKGGTIVKTLQNETGASISVASTVAESEERVITIFAMEDPDSHFSPAQNGVIRVFARSIESGMEKGLDSGKGTHISGRLLVPSNQIGCLMGKGGAIIAEMRKATGAGIWIIAGDQVPKCASENDEVVQINGDFEAVQDALIHVTDRLRDNIMSMSSKAMNGTGAVIYSPTIPETSSFGRAREPISPRRYPSLGFSNNIDHHASLTHSIDHLGLSRNIDRPLSPKIWSSHRSRIPDRRDIPITDLGRSLPRLRGRIDLGSGSKSAGVVNTNYTTVEILVPEHVIGLVYGENGSNLSRIRQISGAKVAVHDPRPGTRDGMVVISGTTDQTQAAESLLQAFILG